MCAPKHSIMNAVEEIVSVSQHVQCAIVDDYISAAGSSDFAAVICQHLINKTLVKNKTSIFSHANGSKFFTM